MPTAVTNAEMTIRNGADLQVTTPFNLRLNAFSLRNDVTLVTNVDGNWQLSIKNLQTLSCGGNCLPYIFEIMAKAPAFATTIDITKIQCQLWLGNTMVEGGVVVPESGNKLITVLA